MSTEGQGIEDDDDDDDDDGHLHMEDLGTAAIEVRKSVMEDGDFAFNLSTTKEKGGMSLEWLQVFLKTKHRSTRNFSSHVNKLVNFNE